MSHTINTVHVDVAVSNFVLSVNPLLPSAACIRRSAKILIFIQERII